MDKLIYEICSQKNNIIKQIRRYIDKILQENNINLQGNNIVDTIQELNNIVDSYLKDTNKDDYKYYIGTINENVIYNMDILFIKITKFQILLIKYLTIKNIENKHYDEIENIQKLESNFICLLLKKYESNNNNINKDDSDININSVVNINNENIMNILINKLMSLFEIMHKNLSISILGGENKKKNFMLFYLYVNNIIKCIMMNNEKLTQFKRIQLKYKLLFSDKSVFNCFRNTKKNNLLQYLIPFNFIINFDNIHSIRDTFKILYDLRNIDYTEQNNINSVALELNLTIITIKVEQFIRILINKFEDQCSDLNLSFVDNKQEIIKVEKYNESQINNEMNIYNDGKKMIVVLLILSNDKFLICQDQSGNFINKESIDTINLLRYYKNINTIELNEQDIDKHFSDNKYLERINIYSNIFMSDPQFNLKNIDNKLIKKNNLYKFIMKKDDDINLKIMYNILINTKLK
jgi:hypothetical protein